MKPPKTHANHGPGAGSEGQRRLRAVAATNAEVAVAMDASKAAVGHWRTGHKIPSRTQRQRLLQLYSIPIEAWDFKAGTSAPKKAKPSKSPKAKVAPAAVDESVPVVTRSSQAMTLDEVDELLADIRRMRGDSGIMVGEFAKLCSAETQALALRERIERSQEDLESRYWESARGRKLVEKIVAALTPHPAAAADVEAVLGEVLA